MSDDFIPVMCSIVESSIVSQPPHVFKAWILMLAAGGIEGRVVGAPGNLARRFELSRNEMEEALSVLSSPDPDSTTPDEEGRRIVPYLDAGRPAWAIVNRKKYHEIVVEKLRKERDRRRKADERGRPGSSEVVQGCPGLSEVVRVSPRIPPVASSYSSLSSSEAHQDQPNKSIQDLALTAIADPCAWTYDREKFTEAIATIWEGCRAWDGKPQAPVPVTHRACLRFLELLADGHKPEEIRDALINAHPNCWARGKGLSAALGSLDSLSRPHVPPGSQKPATEPLSARKSDLQRLREAEAEK